MMRQICCTVWMLGALLYVMPGTANAEGVSPSSILRFRLAADPSTLDWNLARSSDETYVIMNIMEGLVRAGTDLKPQPALAERWVVSADGRTYTFYLRPGVKWSDGKPLKATDFEDSWLRLLDPKTGSNYASFLYDVENAEAFHQGKLKVRSQVGVKAVDDLTFRVQLRRRVPHFLHLPSFWVTFPIRLDLVKKHGSQWATPGKIATLGAYLLTDWKKGSELHLKANPDYHGAQGSGGAMGNAHPSEVIALIEPSEAKARELFYGSKIDFLLNATTEDLLKLSGAGSEKVRVERFPYLATFYLGFRQGKGLLRSRGIRKAIALAVDREGIPAVLQGGQIVARSWLPPGVEGHGAGDYRLPGSIYDAKGELSRAGYVEGAGFPKLPLWVESFDGAQALANSLVKGLHEKLGIRVEPRIGTLAEFRKRISADQPALFVAHWGADYPEASNFFDIFANGSGTNSTGWSSPEYDDLLKRARTTVDPSERLAAYESAERLLLQKEVVIVPLFYSRNTALVGERVEKFHISPLNYLFFTELKLK